MLTKCPVSSGATELEMKGTINKHREDSKIAEYIVTCWLV